MARSSAKLASTKAPSGKVAAEDTLSTQDWIDAARRMLIRDGVGALKVDRLAKECKVTRGGFYWRFGSRQELLKRLLDEWRSKNTEPMLVALRGPGSPSDRLNRTFNLWLDEVQFDPAKTLHVTVDFNAMPYMTLLVSQIWQEGDVWRVHFLKEYCPKPPLSYTKATVQMLADDIKGGTFQGLEAGLFYYGDASGKNNSSMATEEARNNFDHVKNGLRPWLLNGSNRVLNSNPPHTKVRDFMNACFFGDTGIDITFDPSMKTTIRDLRNLKQGADGSILEEKETDEATGVKFVKWGHASQACYYLIVSAFKGHYQHHAKKAA